MSSRHSGTPTPTRRDTRLWWAAASALLLHGLLLQGGTDAPWESRGSSNAPRPLAASPALSIKHINATPWQLVGHDLAAPSLHTTTGSDTSSHPEEHTTTPAAADTRFWRRHEVDQGPIPLHPVVIPYPEGVQVLQAVRGVITLYIDEHGVVLRVEPKDQTLAPAMVQAARDAFLQARFQPALRQQAPARVQIDIEVQFDPPEAPPGNRSLTPGL